MLGVCYTQNVRRMQTLLSMSDGRNLLSLFLRDCRKSVLYSSQATTHPHESRCASAHAAHDRLAYLRKAEEVLLWQR